MSRRSLAPTPGGHDQRRRIFDRLGSAIDAGPVDSYDVSSVGREVSPEVSRGVYVDGRLRRVFPTRIDGDSVAVSACHLVEEHREDAAPETAFRRVVDESEGSYAVAAVVEGVDGIFATATGYSSEAEPTRSSGTRTSTSPPGRSSQSRTPRFRPRGRTRPN